jgi:hypothetical protein
MERDCECADSTLRCHGDGLFESLEYVGFGSATAMRRDILPLPEWALTMLPNRKAAGKIARKTARAALVGITA